ncbi:MAG: choice-of-anchor W domain-containing protein [Cyanobacteria bacterium J06639_1]
MFSFRVNSRIALRLVFPAAIALGALGVGEAIAPEAASAFSVSLRSDLDDAGFKSLIDSGSFVEEFVAQSRIGNNAPNGTQEFDLLDPKNNASPVAQGQRVWPNDDPVEFSLAFDGTNAAYTVGGVTLNGTFSGSISDLFLRTRTLNNTNTSSSLALFDLVLNNTPISESLLTTSGVEYLQISHIGGVPFLLEGKSTFAWTGPTPTNSNLAYQIKAGTTEPVPEPISTAGGAIALAWGASAYRRHKRAARPEGEE